jgi:NitT/TauT family transport system substrate-binding protein
VPQLRLATVSEVPTPWLCLQHDLRRNGIDPERLERVTTHTMLANLEALRNGELDVTQMFEPYVSMAVQQGSGKILYAASARGPTVYTSFLATRDGIARNRSAIAAVVRAIRRMQAWLYQHNAEDLAEVVAPFYPDLPPDLLTNALREAAIYRQIILSCSSSRRARSERHGSRRRW